MSDFTPKKVFILVNGEYEALSFKEFKRRKVIDPAYADRWFIAVNGYLMPYAQPDTLLLKWKQIQDKAKERGYQVVDTTVVTGDDTLSKAAISYIVEHNDSENGAEVIFTLTGHDLSRDLATAQGIVGMITEGGMSYHSADESHVMLDIHDPVGAVLKAVLSGAEDYPGEDGSLEEDDDLMDGEGIVFSM